ncbi:MAG: DUF4136 domain-containing protein [Gammaproteobacteria bacterium]|nr:DUF4136 domain-containing protein [Gammaproteobacteria bacterium]MDH5345008.1 DUF4136 domain-containing protein [Gammaproteobacteria bacterium]
MQVVKRVRQFVLSGAVVLLAGSIAGCATIRTGSHFDETTNFGAWSTFGWIDEEPFIPGGMSLMVSPLAREQIESAIVRELENKGYSFTQDRGNADFVVSYTIGTREEIRIDSYPARYRGDWGWHVPYSYYYYSDVSAHSYTKGTLGVDIFDNESGKPVWHGWAEKTVTESDRRDPKQSIDDGTRLLFADFPH